MKAVAGENHFPRLLMSINQNETNWISLVVQWIRMCLPMQGTWVQSLAQEDSPCWRATKPVHPTEPHDY